MISNTTKEEFFSTNKNFDQLYPPPIRRLSNLHWTPIEVAQKAAHFLAATPGASILDIGSGVGKFCLNAGYYSAECNFFGVEQRSSLVAIANQVQQQLGITNASFIHGNFTQLDFSAFDHFYFYNPFYENLVDESLHIDDSIAHSESLYDYYATNLYTLLATRPPGTRLATYQSSHTRIPSSYQLVSTDVDTLFSCWIKIT
ncbi:methyltransferase domain-containing protein [Chitinophaga sp.]|uniref:class I SAM-dependent methyltransferase n=1 Tax=Chitinophaga sp. TaxID=1869181 RepID=UPI0031DE98C5